MVAERSRAILDTITTIATLAAALAIVWIVVWPRTGRTVQPTAAPSSPVTKLNGLETTIGMANKHRDGATLAIIEFSDFECPYCGRYARDTYPQVQRDLVEKGVVDYSFRQFPLESIHKAAFKAGEASACAGEQGKFWEMHERLFQNQQQLDPASLLSYASSLGVDAPRFQTCLAGQMVQRIRDDEDEAKRLGVNSTPTFLVGLLKQNGKVQVLRKIAGAVPYETFKSVVDEVLKGA